MSTTPENTGLHAQRRAADGSATRRIAPPGSSARLARSVVRAEIRRRMSTTMYGTPYERWDRENALWARSVTELALAGAEIGEVAAYGYRVTRRLMGVALAQLR